MASLLVLLTLAVLPATGTRRCDDLSPRETRSYTEAVTEAVVHAGRRVVAVHDDVESCGDECADGPCRTRCAATTAREEHADEAVATFVQWDSSGAFIVLRLVDAKHRQLEALLSDECDECSEAGVVKRLGALAGRLVTTRAGRDVSRAANPEGRPSRTTATGAAATTLVEALRGAGLARAGKDRIRLADVTCSRSNTPPGPAETLPPGDDWVWFACGRERRKRSSAGSLVTLYQALEGAGAIEDCAIDACSVRAPHLACDVKSSVATCSFDGCR